MKNISSRRFSAKDIAVIGLMIAIKVVLTRFLEIGRASCRERV